MATPAWSADATHVAYATKDGLHVVEADGGHDVRVAAGAVRDPRWSRTGTSLSFLRGTNLVVRIGNATRSYPVGKGALNNAWLPGGKAVLYVDSGARLTRLDLRTGKHRILATGGQFTLSPSGTSVAFATGAECRDRVGIYVVDTDGSGRRRLTNSCTITGTSGPDVLHGDFSRVLLGLGGDDALYADDTYYFFDGNTLIGGPGNDRLAGGFAQDTLLGGPGDDMITGGASRDVINGGPGRDRIDAGGGGDVVYARDGQRDVVHCGRNRYGKAGRDIVYADRIDAVGSDCEIVHRS